MNPQIPDSRQPAGCIPSGLERCVRLSGCRVREYVGVALRLSLADQGAQSFPRLIVHWYFMVYVTLRVFQTDHIAMEVHKMSWEPEQLVLAHTRIYVEIDYLPKMSPPSG